MAGDPVEGMARALCWADCEIDLQGGCRSPDECRPACRDLDTHKARAAWAYALATLRAPGGAHLAAYYDSRLFLDTFERENGLTMPRDGPQEPPQAVSGLGSVSRASDAVSPTGGASMAVSEITTKDQS